MNVDIDALNDKMLSVLPGQIRKYSSADTLCSDDVDNVQQNIIL